MKGTEGIKKGDKVFIDTNKSIYGEKLYGGYYFDSFEKKDNNEVAYINKFKGSDKKLAIKTNQILRHEKH